MPINHPTRKPKYSLGNSRYTSDVLVYSRYKADIKKKESDIKAQQKIIDNADLTITIQENNKSTAYAFLQGDPGNTYWIGEYDKAVATIAKQKDIQKNAHNAIKKLNTERNSLSFKHSQSSYTPQLGGGSVPLKKTDSSAHPPFTYKYNAPMVMSAYNNPFGPQVDAAGSSNLITSPGNFSDARKAWKTKSDGSVEASKGVIQMSQWLVQQQNVTSANRKQAYFDDRMYGFKFLYNPTSVSMSWGVNTEVNTQMESMGLDKSSPLTSGLFSSTISFELLLNRVGDLAFLQENGQLKPADPVEFINTYDFKGTVGGFRNPYPEDYTISAEDGKMIYRKGTMYDIEYLFKAVNGYNASYKSTLNGLTADRGWLFALPVELHLGAGLRYLVRLTSLSVNHNMFNERMVPILSTVSIVCSRYYDGQELTKDTKDTKKK